MVSVQHLIEVASYLRIIHHTKGRIRVRVDPAIKERSGDVSLEGIKELPRKIEGLERVKINKAVGSITVNYDPDIFPDQLFSDLVEGRNVEKIAARLNTLIKEIE